jgi:hypothetical protein
MNEYTIDLKLICSNGTVFTKKCSMEDIERDLAFEDGDLLNQMYYDLKRRNYYIKILNEK